MPRSYWQSTDTAQRADALEFSTKASNDIWSLGFGHAADQDIEGLSDHLKLADPLPVVVSDRPDAMQIRAQQQQQASSTAVGMPEQASSAPNGATSAAPGRQTAPNDATSAVAMPSGGGWSGGQTPTGGGKADRYASQIAQVSQESGVPYDVLAGLIDTESSGEDSVSPAGARGIMQVVPGQGYDLPGENAADPLTSIRQGARAVMDKYRATGSWEQAGRAYFGYGVDAGGMTTDRYGQIYDANRARYQGGATPNAGATPPAPAAPSSSPAAAAPPPSSSVAGAPQGELTIRNTRTGQQLRALPSEWGPYYSAPDWEIVSGGPDTMQKVAGADVPETGLSAGDQKRAKLAAMQGEQTMLRQPLMATQGPDTATGQEYDPRDADTGAHELPGQVPGNATQYPESTSPASYGASGDDPGNSGTTSPPMVDASGTLSTAPSQLSESGLPSVEAGVPSIAPASYGNGQDDPGSPPSASPYTVVPSTAPLASDAGQTQEVTVTPSPSSRYQVVGSDQPLASDQGNMVEMPVTRPGSQAATQNQPEKMTARQVPVWDSQGNVIGYRQQDDGPPTDPTISDPNYTQPAGLRYDPSDPSTGVNPQAPGSLRPTDLPPELQGGRPWLPATTPVGGIQAPPGLVDSLVPRAAQTGPLFDEPSAPQRWSPAFQSAYANPSYEAAPFQDDQREPATGYRPAPRVVSPYTPGSGNALAGVETPPSDQQILQGQGTIARSIDSGMTSQGYVDQHPESLVSLENQQAFMNPQRAATPGGLADWRDRVTVGEADALARGLGQEPENVLATVWIGGQPHRMTVSDLLQNVTDPLFIGGFGVGGVVLDGVGHAALSLAAPYLKGAARVAVRKILQVAPVVGDAIEAGGHRALDAMEAGGRRVAEAWRTGRQIAADANAADDGLRTLGVAGPAPTPESRIPRAGYATDLSPGAETLVRRASEANAPAETVSRADVAQRAEQILGVSPEDAQRWQSEALGEAPDARAVRGEALRQAEYVDAENANRAIERLRVAQERARAAGGAENLPADERFDVADALLEAANASRAFDRSAAASTAEGRATARALNQRRNAITARQAFESAERARQVGQDAAFAAREVQRASRAGQVTPQGAARLRVLRDKLLEAERHGLVGDGASGRLDALEQPAEAATTAAATVGPVTSAPAPRQRLRLRSQVEREQAAAAARVGPTSAARPQVGLGTRLATDIGNSVLGAGVGGGVGYAAPASSDEERRKNAQAGAVVGAIGYPIVGRVLRDRGGVRALLGPAPTPEVPNRSIAIGADPAKRYEFRYRVADLGDLVPSNLPTGAPNPAFPRELQPRSRERVASQLQIGKIAASLDPVALLHDAGRLDSGPPIVGADNLVESGNGRTLAIARAAEQHPERYQAYVQTLRDNLGEFGLSERDLQGVRRPVLVRERVSPVDRPSFVSEANGSVVQRMSPAEQAAQSAANLSDDVVAQLQIGENDSIAAALRRADNRDIVRQWIGAIPENERAELLDKNGEISPQGYDQLANALLTRTYGEGATTRAFIEAGNPEVRNVQTAVMGSLPDMARAEALIRGGLRDPGLSIAEDVAKATEVLARLKQAGQTVGDYVKQVAMGERELTPFQEQVLQFLDQNQRRPSAIRSALREYAGVVENAADPNQADMFGGMVASVTKEDAWASATAGVQRERQARIAAQRSKVAAENAARTPAAGIVPSTGGPEGSLAQEGAPTPLAAPTAAERGTLPAGGPEGRLAREGAPPEAANLPPVGDVQSGNAPVRTWQGQDSPQARFTDATRPGAVGDLSTGGSEGTLTLASGRSVKDVAAQIDQVLANPRAPGAVERLQQLHQDLQEISTQGFARSSDIRRRLQRNGLLRAGLASKDQNVDGLVQALANVDPDHPEQMRAVLQIISKPRLIDRVLEYQYVNMLSSPITQGVNATANAMQMAGRLFFQNPLEYAYSGGRSTGVGAAFEGAARGFREALPEVRQIMRTGVSSDDIARATEMGSYSQVGRELLTERFGKAGALLHVISTRPLQAMDALFGQMAYASAAEQYAQRTADRLLQSGAPKVKGMSREQARQYILANVWDYPEIVEKAGKIQDYTLLKSNDASNKGFGVLERQLRQMAALGHAPADADFARQVLAFGVNNVLPFFNVPLNSAKQGIERTAGVPVNVVRAVRAYRAGDTERGAELMAKATIGAAALTTAGVLAAGDNLTGEGPGGADQAIWEQDHRRNSWRVPGTQTWFSWEGTPLAIPFGMMAGAKQGWSEAQQRAQKAGKTDPFDLYGTAALKGGQGAVQGFASQSFIRAMGDQYKLLTGQETGLATVANQATSNVSRFVPASGMLNFLANVSDTLVRDPGRPLSFSDLPQNVTAREANRLPGLRQQVDPRLTPYGEPTRNEQFGVAGALPYFRGGGVGAGDPITQRLEAAGTGAIQAPPQLTVTFRGRSYGQIPLTMAEQRRFNQIAGQEFRRELEGAGAATANWTPDVYDKIRNSARAVAEGQVLGEIGGDEINRRLAARPAPQAVGAP